MNIKQSITLLLLFFGVSFRASALVSYVFFGETRYAETPQDITEQISGFCSYIPSQNKSQKYIGVLSVSSSFVTVSTSYHIGKDCQGYGSPDSFRLNYKSNVSCPEGAEFNPETFKCEAPPPACTDDQIYNPATELCEPRWCNSDEATSIFMDYMTQCEAQNGLFVDYQCDDLSKSITSKCDLTHKDKCVVGLPAWPACLGDIYNPKDPTNPIDPPTDFNPETSNPSPEPPPPSDTQSMHHDMNKNFNDVNNTLKSMDNTNKEIGKKIVEQMQQDAAIYENNKLLTQQIGTDTVNAINSQTKSLLDGTQDTVNAINGLGNSINNLADTLKPCDPNTDPTQCQGPHGLNESFINNGMSDLANAVNSQIGEHETTFMQTVDTASKAAISTETQSYITLMTNDIVNALPRSSECTNTSMDTPFGSFSLGCDFSTRIKEILAYVIYIYTLFTLSEILFSTVTPVAGTVPYSSRR